MKISFSKKYTKKYDTKGAKPSYRRQEIFESDNGSYETKKIPEVVLEKVESVPAHHTCDEVEKEQKHPHLGEVINEVQLHSPLEEELSGATDASINSKRQFNFFERSKCFEVPTVDQIPSSFFD